ncbi:MAG TPA: S8 family serine peptidase [Bacillota bacterium]|nr:S8 family serine peptidase [Bacillota bacterium]
MKLGTIGLYILFFLLTATMVYAQEDTTQLKIAVLDTGVDETLHSLNSMFIPGLNLVQPGNTPHDDHGHGTSVVGALVGADQDKWKSQIKIMPIKVLDQDAYGDPQTVAEGIRLAVDKGARILVLSLADPIYSKELEEAVQYAESKGSLVIAAAGNDGGDVAYPAAFPTVLSVGAVDHNQKLLSYSNKGPELKVVSLGENIETITRGGRAIQESGTSMAAPQVARVAAKVWIENPKLTPFQVRHIIEATADPLDKEGWNAQTGFGLVNEIHAIQMAMNPPETIFTQNHSFEQAATISTSSQLQGMLTPDSPGDWYKIHILDDGIIHIYNSKPSHMVLYGQDKELVIENTGEIDSAVKKGVVYLYIATANRTREPYLLNTTFHIQPESISNNYREDSETKPAAEDLQIVGRFEVPNDEDWYRVSYPSAGRIQVKVTTDTLRMDPVLTVETANQKEVLDNSIVEEGKRMESMEMPISAGEIFFHLQDYYHHAVNGKYQLSVHYTPDM